MKEFEHESEVVAESGRKSGSWLPKLRWFAAEILIVICGVLIALALNTWRSNQLDQQTERELYTDIIAEFEINLSILEDDLATNDSTYLIISSLNDLSDSELLALPSEVLTNRFGDVIDVAGFDPEIGIVQAIVETSNLGTFSDGELRVLLSKWAGLLEAKRRFGVQVFEFANQNTFPLRARATSDLIWTEGERRELQSIYRTYSFFHVLLIRNQRDLYATALEITTYLKGLQE